MYYRHYHTNLELETNGPISSNPKPQQ